VNNVYFCPHVQYTLFLLDINES